MASSPYLLAMRAFVSVVLALCAAGHTATTVNRDSDDKDLLRIYRRLLLKVHPDKGGKNVDMQRFQETQALGCLHPPPQQPKRFFYQPERRQVQERCLTVPGAYCGRVSAFCLWWLLLLVLSCPWCLLRPSLGLSLVWVCAGGAGEIRPRVSAKVVQFDRGPT